MRLGFLRFVSSLAVFVLVASVVLPSAAAPDEHQASVLGGSGPALYEPLLPVRILDSRNDVDGDLSAPVGAGGTGTTTVAGVGGVPSDGVGAVVINVTAVAASADTHLTVYPHGRPRPAVSTVHVTGEQSASNLTVVEVGDGGQVDVYNHDGEVDVTFDVIGYLPRTPLVAITEPQAGDVLFETARISSAATGDADVVQVEFFLGDELLAVADEEPYVVDFDTLAHADGEHDLRAIAIDADGLRSTHRVPVYVDNDLEDLTRLHLDFQRDTIGVDEYVIGGLQAIYEPHLLSERYRGPTGSHGSHDFALLADSLSSAAVTELDELFTAIEAGYFYPETDAPADVGIPSNGGSTTDGDRQETEPGAGRSASGGDQLEAHCQSFDIPTGWWGPAQRGLRCSYTHDDRFELRYSLEGYDGGLPRDDANGSGLPDLLDDIIDGLDESWGAYSALGYDEPQDDPIVVRINHRPGRSYAPPPGLRFWTNANEHILIHTLRDDGSERNVNYLARHELFHLFQWEYATDIDLLDSGTRMFVEASAEWATAQSYPSHPRPIDYANNLRSFLGRPSEALATYDNLTPFNSGREYGAFIFVEWVVAHTEDLESVREVWEGIRDGKPALEALDEVLAARGTSYARLLAGFARANYRLGADQGDAIHTSPDVAAWTLILEGRDSATESDARGGARPARTSADMSAVAAHGDLSVEAGGTAYIDVWGEIGSSRSLVVDVTALGPADAFNLDLLPFAEHPELCAGAVSDPTLIRQSGIGAEYQIVATLSDECTMATLAITHTDPLTTDRLIVHWSTTTVPASWATVDFDPSYAPGRDYWTRHYEPIRAIYGGPGFGQNQSAGHTYDFEITGSAGMGACWRPQNLWLHYRGVGYGWGGSQSPNPVELTINGTTHSLHFTSYRSAGTGTPIYPWPNGTTYEGFASFRLPAGAVGPGNNRFTFDAWSRMRLDYVYLTQNRC